MKILVLQLKRIGDLILTTPALFALRQNFPDAHITLAVENGCRELLPAIDYVTDTLVFSRSGKNGALWRKLLFASYDICLDLTGNDRSALFSVLSKAQKRVAFQWIQKSPMRPLFYNHFVDSPVRESHTVDHYLDILQGVGALPGTTPVTLHLPEWSHKKARQLLDECGLNAPFVIVHPGTARPEKYWLAGRWAEVVEFCGRELGLPCVITGGRDPVEMEHVEKIKSALQDPGAAPDLCGRLDLLTLAALMQEARLVLSCDSAPMHLAAAFGTPQIALFGMTNPFHWRPRHDRAMVVVAGRGALASLREKVHAQSEFKPHDDGAPMSEISTEQVIGAITSLFSKHVQTP